MTKEQIQGIVRHALTFVGGILIMKGLATDSSVQELIGAAVTLVGGVWSIISKKKQLINTKSKKKGELSENIDTGLN